MKSRQLKDEAKKLYGASIDADGLENITETPDDSRAVTFSGEQEVIPDGEKVEAGDRMVVLPISGEGDVVDKVGAQGGGET